MKTVSGQKKGPRECFTKKRGGESEKGVCVIRVAAKKGILGAFLGGKAGSPTTKRRLETGGSVEGATGLTAIFRTTLELEKEWT